MALADEVRKAILSVEGVVESDSIFDEGEMAYFVNGKQMAEWWFEPDVISIRLTWPVIRDNKAELQADERVLKWKSGTDWLQVRFTRRKDIPYVRDLIERAAAQYSPPAGQPAKLPPQGTDLARRRRFH